MLSRRRFTQSAPALLLAKPSRRTNLLFLIADDHAAYVMGADGNSGCETPHLDALARQGLRFSNHYCNSPVCTPSRQSLLTGQMPHAAGVTLLNTPLADGKPTLARQLKAAGYTTAVFGKMHFNRPGASGLHGFDTMMTEPEVARAWLLEPAKAVDTKAPVKPLPWRPFQTPARQWLNAENLPYPRFDEGMRGSFIVRQASAFLRERGSEPFALWVSLMEPHSPFDYPVEDRGHFDPSRFPVPVVGPQDGSQIPLIFRDLTPEQKQGVIAAYYTSARFMDRNMGRVLSLLRQLRLDDNTLVVYTADHGYCLGHHGRFEKHCGYDPALRVPLIMRCPGRVTPGVVSDFTEHLDLGPTILETLGAPPLPLQHGQSLRPYLERKPHPTRRDHIVSEYLENEEVFVRTGRFKLIFGSGRRERQDGYRTDNPTPGRYVRLYDLKNDPGEFHDVAGEHPDEVVRLEDLALRRFRETHPEAKKEPARLGREEALEYYLPPRDQVAPARKPD